MKPIGVLFFLISFRKPTLESRLFLNFFFKHQNLRLFKNQITAQHSSLLLLPGVQMAKLGLESLVESK
jgi:hypothetical protein